MAKVINLKHCQQESIGFCLPACVQMALQYYGKSSTQREIAALFGTSKGIGTPFSRITLLQQRGFAVKLIEWSSIEPLIDAIRADRLVIASVAGHFD